MKRPFNWQLLASTATVVLLLAAGVPSAYGGYIASTIAIATSGNFPPDFSSTARASYDYNGVPTGGGGPSQFGSFFSTSPTNASASGTVDSTGALTASLDNASTGDSSSFASADLSTGTLKASAASILNTEATAIAEYSDVLHLTISGANAATITLIGLQFSLSGTVNIDPTIFPLPEVAWTVQANSAMLSIVIRANSINTFGNGVCPGLPKGVGECITQETVLGWDSSSFPLNDPQSIIFNAVLAVQGATPTVTLTDTLNVFRMSDGASADYSHTSLTGLTLPSGVTYTSDSGVFLSGQGPSSGVPEPSTFALIGLSLVGMATVRRRRAQRRS